MEKVSKIQIGCSKYDIQDSEARELIQELSENVLRNLDVEATVDNTTGTPSVYVIKGDNKLTLNFSGLKGETGQKGEDGAPGRDGQDGKDGVNGVNGSDGQRGPQGMQGIQGERGERGLPGPQGVPGAAPIYDDTEIRLLIDDEHNRISQFLDRMDSEITAKVSLMVEEADWWQQNYPEGGGSQSNFGVQDVKEYLQTIGLWYTSDAVTNTTWSKIHQTYDGIVAEVNSLRADINAGGPINYEALTGTFYNYLTGSQEGDTITAGIRATWAKFFEMDADDIQMLKWVSSGIENYANNDEAVSHMFSALHDYEQKQEAYAGLQVEVENLGTDLHTNYVTRAALSTEVSNEVDSQIRNAGFITSSTLPGATATMYAHYTDSDVISSVANIFAIANADGSEIKLDADRINLNGIVWADLINTEEVVAQGLNSLSGSKVSVNGNGILVSQSTGATTILPGQILFGTSGAGTNYISNGALSIGYMRYSDSDNKLNIGYIDANQNINAGGDITFDDYSKLHNITSSAALTILAEGNLNLRGSDISIGDSTTETIVASTTISSSDERVKNIIGDVDVSVEDIAATRIVNYEFKENPGKIKTGSIAQDWQTIIPNAVRTIDSEDHLGLDYSAISIVSAVVDAREIVKLKQENEELKQRLAAIEERLANL